jgi:hypothetical protein
MLRVPAQVRADDGNILRERQFYSLNGSEESTH